MDHLNAPLGRIDIPSAEAMEALGSELSGRIGSGCVIGLSGELGTGKTTLARGLVAAALAAAGRPPEEVPSPTYTLVQHYPFPTDGDPDRSIWHMDLWRLEEPGEIHELGFEEALGRHVSVIEWPERIAPFLPGHTLLVGIGYRSGGGGPRVAEFRTGESAASEWERKLAGIPLELQQ